MEASSTGRRIIPEYYKLTVNERRVFFLRDNLTESEIANAKEQGANMDYYLPSGNEARIARPTNSVIRV